MTLADWSALFYEGLSGLLAAPIEYGLDRYGHHRANLGRFGVLVIGDDDDFGSVWLLDSEGRTDGPVWDDILTVDTAEAAVSRVFEAIAALPAVPKFGIFPPGEAVVNPDAIA